MKETDSTFSRLIIGIPDGNKLFYIGAVRSGSGVLIAFTSKRDGNYDIIILLNRMGQG